ncbi:MAG TPA: tol-pal system protein YbgF [Pseudolabrys sp.]|nr:tol-pal system protein YbgF [Pseudolabrys sp.]
MTFSTNRMCKAALVAAPLLLLAGGAFAQDRGGLFGNLFNRGDEQAGPTGSSGPPNASDIAVRVDRLESQIRQLTGTIEQLQYQNQQLQLQLKRMQGDAGYRPEQPAAMGGAPRAAAQSPLSSPPPISRPAVVSNPTQPTPIRDASGKRSDEFDPSQHPNAAGVGRTLNGEAGISPPPMQAREEPPIGAPGGRMAGSPLDLSTMTSDNRHLPMQGGVIASAGSQLPAPPPRNVSATGQQLATLPPSASPQDEYDLAYGYVLHKDYALAEQAFRDFLKKYPSEHLAPDAQYWLGESLYQRQRYRDAGESFLAVTTKYEHSGKAPEALLRLGQSLAAMHQKEAACATFGEVARKYPRASTSVKRGATQEQKREHC